MGKWIIPYRVVGVDSNDKRAFMNEQGHWVSGADAATFSESVASTMVKEWNAGNRYRDSNDRIEATIERAD